MKDLTGLIFGKLTVLEIAIRPENLKTNGTYWKVSCQCGVTKIVASSCLVGNHATQSCGCIKSPNLIGRKFGRGEVIAFCGITDDSRKSKIWLLQCECGNTYKTITNRLTAKNFTGSCGCSRIGKNSKNYKGYKDISGEHWNSIKNNAKKCNRDFNISIEEAWFKFIDQGKKCALTSWDIVLSDENRKTNQQTASLDRIDSSKGYTLENIQWLHKDVNRLKSNFSEDYFIKICNAITKNN